MTSIRIDAEVIFQVKSKSRRDPITQSLRGHMLKTSFIKMHFASHGRGRS
ncbi:hypothetical protein ABIA45_007238 [Bradyrhizobium sp. USDA 336]|uniref:Uncharacterized protein n=1 Tax=Bradyrhizobium yuanmingense TaxID=108015 RepID=A0ABV4GNK5_9BRAD